MLHQCLRVSIGQIITESLGLFAVTVMETGNVQKIVSHFSHSLHCIKKAIVCKHLAKATTLGGQAVYLVKPLLT